MQNGFKKNGKKQKLFSFLKYSSDQNCVKGKWIKDQKKAQEEKEQQTDVLLDLITYSVNKKNILQVAGKIGSLAL